MGDDLAAQCLARIKQTNTLTPENIRALADYLFAGFGEGVIRFTSGSRGGLETGKGSPALVAQFLELASQAIGQWTAGPERNSAAKLETSPIERSGLAIARLLLPYFDEHLPEKSAALKARLGEASNGNADDADRVQDLLNRAETAKDEPGRDRLYWSAAMAAVNNRDLKRATRILEKVSSEPMRAQIERSLNGLRDEERSASAQRALDSGDLNAARKLISEISDPGRQFAMLCNTAVSLTYKNDAARAAQILDDARQLVTNSQPGMDKARNLFQLASVAARVALQRGFDDLKAAVDAINTVQVVSRWQDIETVADSKSGTATRRNTGLGVLRGPFENAFSQLGGVDLDRALQLAQGIQLQEASALAQLAACRGVLTRTR
jgi:hypothetical protein